MHARIVLDEGLFSCRCNVGGEISLVLCGFVWTTYVCRTITITFKLRTLWDCRESVFVCLLLSIKGAHKGQTMKLGADQSLRKAPCIRLQHRLEVIEYIHNLYNNSHSLPMYRASAFILPDKFGVNLLAQDEWKAWRATSAEIDPTSDHYLF